MCSLGHWIELTKWSRMSIAIYPWLSSPVLLAQTYSVLRLVASRFLDTHGGVWGVSFTRQDTLCFTAGWPLALRDPHASVRGRLCPRVQARHQFCRWRGACGRVGVFGDFASRCFGLRLAVPSLRMMLRCRVQLQCSWVSFFSSPFLPPSIFPPCFIRPASPFQFTSRCRLGSRQFQRRARHNAIVRSVQQFKPGAMEPQGPNAGWGRLRQDPFPFFPFFSMFVLFFDYTVTLLWHALGWIRSPLKCWFEVSASSPSMVPFFVQLFFVYACRSFDKKPELVVGNSRLRVVYFAPSLVFFTKFSLHPEIACM
jgi:hypothetical protein